MLTIEIGGGNVLMKWTDAGLRINLLKELIVMNGIKEIPVCFKFIFYYKLHINT